MISYSEIPSQTDGFKFVNHTACCVRLRIKFAFNATTEDKTREEKEDTGLENGVRRMIRNNMKVVLRDFIAQL